MGLLCIVFAKAGPAQHYPWEVPIGATDSVGALGPNAYAIINKVTIEGNRKTRRDIVLREMQLQPGDTLKLESVEARLFRERQILINTNLFSEVELLLLNLDTFRHEVDVRVSLREKWYFYPGVSFDLADRNFNVWWTEQNASLDRVNYGLKLKHNNFTGRADRLILFAQAGYTRKAEIKYEIPYIDRAKVLGIEFGFLLDRNREWAAFTEDGIQRFYGIDTVNVLRRRRYRVALNIRPGLFATHKLRLERQTTRADARLVTEANPNFFGDGRLEQSYWGFQYLFTLDRRDLRAFALKGDYLRFKLEKEGLGLNDDLNRLSISLRYRQFVPLFAGLNLSLDGKVKTDVERTEVPYFSRKSLGFGDDFVRGYQFYVVDGLDYAYFKTTLRRRLFQTRISAPFIEVKRLKQVPLQVYLGVHGDLGGMRDPFETPGNVLANQMLSSYGVGLYAVIFNNKVARLEYSRNDLGEWGLFLTYALGF